MTFQYGLAQYFFSLGISDFSCSRIAESDPVVVVDEEDSLFHGAKDCFQNRQFYFGIHYSKNNILSFVGQAGLFEFPFHQCKLEISCCKVKKREMGSISLGPSAEMAGMASG
jgi:hypothetical protein